MLIKNNFFLLNQRTSPRSTISTTLFTSPSSVEYATRTAKILARRIGLPVYVGCSIDSLGLGLMVEEEMEGLRKIVETVMERWEQRNGNVNGINGHGHEE